MKIISIILISLVIFNFQGIAKGIDDKILKNFPQNRFDYQQIKSPEDFKEWITNSAQYELFYAGSKDGISIFITRKKEAELTRDDLMSKIQTGRFKETLWLLLEYVELGIDMTLRRHESSWVKVKK